MHLLRKIFSKNSVKRTTTLSLTIDFVLLSPSEWMLETNLIYDQEKSIYNYSPRAYSLRPNSSTRRGSGPKSILFGLIQRIPALRNLMSSNAILQFDFTNATTKNLIYKFLQNN